MNKAPALSKLLTNFSMPIAANGPVNLSALGQGVPGIEAATPAFPPTGQMLFPKRRIEAELQETWDPGPVGHSLMQKDSINICRLIPFPLQGPTKNWH